MGKNRVALPKAEGPGGGREELFLHPDRPCPAVIKGEGGGVVGGVDAEIGPHQSASAGAEAFSAFRARTMLPRMPLMKEMSSS